MGSHVQCSFDRFGLLGGSKCADASEPLSDPVIPHHSMPHSIPTSGQIIALILLMAVGMGDAPADEGRFYLNRFWQTSEGMPSNVVYDTAKDSDGFLWIATGAGVARFDGVRFEVFTTLDGLPDTQIYCLHIDRKGRVWVGTRHGAAFRENGKWHVELANHPVFSLGEGADGAIWIGTYTGCWRWAKGKVTQINLGKMIPDIRSFLSDGDHGMWILTQGNLGFWRPDRPGLVEEVAGPWVGKDLRDLTRDREGRVILCGTGILLRRQDNGWEDLGATIPGGGQDANLSCAIAPDDTLWVATRNRGLIFVKGSETGSVDATKGLSLDDARSVMIDQDGMIWAGTNGGGINSLRRRIFDTYSTREGLGRTVTSALVITPDNTVLAGTDGGGIFRKEDGSFIPCYQNMGLPESGLIWSLCAHSDGSLWAGSYREGLFRIFNDHVERIPPPPGTIRNAVSALYETRDGGLLIGTHNEGVRKWRDGHFDPSIRALASSEGNVIYDLLEDHQGQIWVATGAFGLWRFKDGTWKEIAHDGGIPDLLAAVFHESPNGDLWIGSLGQGLIRYRDNHFSKWTIVDGLVSNTICQILEDDTGHLWLGSDQGLQRVSVQALDAYQPGNRRVPLESIRFGRDEGLPTPQFSGEHGNLAVRAKDGSLWFSLASGAIRVDPNQVSKSKAVPVVRVESASVDKGPIWNFEDPETTGKIVVEPGAGTLQVRFTSPDFVAPERGRFQYRMAGLENEWQDVEGTRVASYASLPPGTYQFEALGANSDGIWNPKPTRVEVVIKPFLWQTLGFRLVVAAVILAILGFLIRTWSLRRLRRRLAHVEQERRVDKERARIARDLHDELGATLTEINYLGTLAADSVADSPMRTRVEGMVDRAQRMAKSLDEIVWTVNPANDSLSSTANYLCSRTQESLAVAGIRCRLDVADNLPATMVNSDLRHHLLMAVNEAVHNVMKHSGATECTLSVQTDRGTLVVSVADNGTGFVAVAEPGTRNGLVNLRRRMEASAGSAGIESGDQGTIVTLRVPLP